MLHPVFVVTKTRNRDQIYPICDIFLETSLHVFSMKGGKWWSQKKSYLTVSLLCLYYSIKCYFCQVFNVNFFLKLVKGLEPITCGLQNHCSASWAILALATAIGFEPMIPFGMPVFKTGAISQTLPRCRIYSMNSHQ